MTQQRIRQEFHVPFNLYAIALVLVAVPSLAQVPLDSSQATSAPLAVFIDCESCNLDYIRGEIPYVDYVFDRHDADVHVLVTSQEAGGGVEYSIFFFGLGRFDGIWHNLSVVSSFTDTEDESREAVAQRIRLGLVHFLARTPAASQLKISYQVERDKKTTDDKDKWNYWSFRIRLDGNAYAEESVNSFRVQGRLNADRVTDDWKIRLLANGSYYEENFDLGDDGTVESVIRNGTLSGRLSYSLGRQWSLGGTTRLTTSSFRNTSLLTTLSPAIEFNIFPYSQSTRRSLTLAYYLGLEAYNYEEVTVFDKTEQVLLRQEFEATLDFTQPWGSGSGELEFSNYITDFSQSLWDLYRFTLSGYTEIRIARGLSFTLSIDVSRVRDQIFLPKRTASPEDILLGRVALPTNYEFNAAIGLAYRFGSIFNNIVNPRFGF